MAMNDETYTVEEVAKLFKISKHTVYELIKRRELHAFKVGNKMRIDKIEVERFKKADSSAGMNEQALSLLLAGSHDFLIEHLIKYVTKQANFLSIQPTYIGSLEGLMMLYRGNCDVAAIHLLDPSSGEYNLPFIKLFFVHEPLTVIRLASREQGFIVAQGNPKEIQDFTDLTRKEITFVNRQKGSGTRFLLDSHLAKENIEPSAIKGYSNEEWNHLSTATYISRGIADVGLGIRSAAEQLNLDFIPVANEQFDLVLRWNKKNKDALQHLLDIIQLTSFKESIRSLKGYNTHEFGKIIHEKNRGKQ
ncbi:substrate-binding domain-containing protein [Robertmurraya sp. DFI.2.37]|uniref:substrate-binding domain-containing protein n=1 Tax=Robertmurraya sp. DFI.2.37 TaxID=3031819 RepID=UPI001CDA23A2|nr:substrate-binding domain-containing protein [Robertmurraya sp. DFI.2.37]MDF1511387.1 substrate-binding domain-containing protein [Robertmurraya sp. DFI.2.37]